MVAIKADFKIRAVNSDLISIPAPQNMIIGGNFWKHSPVPPNFYQIFRNLILRNRQFSSFPPTANCLDAELESGLVKVEQMKRARFTEEQIIGVLRQQGEPSGINRIYRLYREEGLTVRKRRARRRAVVARRRSSSRPGQMPAGYLSLVSRKVLHRDAPGTRYFSIIAAVTSLG